jgi:NTP pyrophosphatase (non-canonical NTP hydrolase)
LRFRLYEDRERGAYGWEWTLDEVTLGLVGDVGDLAKLVEAREGARDVAGDLQARLTARASDILWSAIVIAENCGVDLEASFAITMDEIEARLVGPA